MPLSWTPPTILTTGAVLSSPVWNAVATDVAFLSQAPYTMLYDSAGTSIPSAADTQVQLGGTVASNYGFSVISNNAVVPLAGIYTVQFSVQCIPGGGSGGDFLQAQAFQNGNEVLSGSLVPSYTIEPASNGGGLIRCAENDQIGLVAFQNSGTTVTTSSMSNATFLHIAFVGFQ